MTKEEALEAKRVADAVLASYEVLAGLKTKRDLCAKMAIDGRNIDVNLDGYISASIVMNSESGRVIWKAVLDHLDAQITKVQNKINGL